MYDRSARRMGCCCCCCCCSVLFLSVRVLCVMYEQNRLYQIYIHTYSTALLKDSRLKEKRERAAEQLKQHNVYIIFQSRTKPKKEDFCCERHGTHTHREEFFKRKKNSHHTMKRNKNRSGSGVEMKSLPSPKYASSGKN